ncbi:MAG: S24 family peptidase [Dysgonomonas sp.]|nr:S24 family peptidase [Dysgonomonas sp.]
MKEILTQKDRIIEFLEKKGISKNKFYTQTGVSNGTLDKKSGITGDTISKIYAAYPELNLDWLITGQGDMMRSSGVTIGHDLERLKEQFASIMAVKPETLSDESVLNPNSQVDFMPLFAYNEPFFCQGYISLPNLASCDGAGVVKTDSMYPLIKPGDLICFKTGSKNDRIYWGEMYVMHLEMDGEEFLTVKYLTKSDLGPDYVHITGVNEKYRPKDIPKECILWRAVIRAYVAYNSIM